MGELMPGNFGKTKVEKPPVNPFGAKIAKGRFDREPIFSENGVVEYRTGIKPKHEENVLRRVVIHIQPLVETIEKMVPNSKFGQEIDEELNQKLINMSSLELVAELDSSTIADWIENPEVYLALAKEAEARELTPSA